MLPIAVESESVLLWQRSDKLCASDVVDDVIFVHKPRLLDVAAQLKRSAHAASGLAIKVIPVADPFPSPPLLPLRRWPLKYS